jgi:hypothetical protein
MSIKETGKNGKTRSANPREYDLNCIHVVVNWHICTYIRCLVELFVSVIFIRSNSIKELKINCAWLAFLKNRRYNIN